MERTCTNCGVTKDLETGFYTRSRNPEGYDTKCKDCSSAESNAGYHRNRQHVTGLIEERRDRNRQFVWDYCKIHPCVECGETDPVVLEFDHVRGKKIEAVSKLIQNTRSLEAIEAEVAKCEVVCANCHKRRTAISQKWYAKTR